MAVFKRAERRRVKLKLAITGPSGSGKTFSALEVASGLGARVALVDTENDSASLYSEHFAFDSMVIQPPYTINKYVEAIKAAVAEKYDVLVIDSISHAWAGEGGLMAKKDALDARGGNSYTNWAGITKEQEVFKAQLLNSDIHLICTMRSKQDYVLENNDKGKSVPRKVGMAPIQRDGMEYEFTTVFDVAMDHNASTSKDRTGLFDNQIAKLSKQVGEKFIAWLNSVAPPIVAASPEPGTFAAEDVRLKRTCEQIAKDIGREMMRINVTEDTVNERAKIIVNKSLSECNEVDLEKLLAAMKKVPSAK